MSFFLNLKSWKLCALPAITIITLWQLIHLGTWCSDVVIHGYTFLVPMNQRVLNKLSRKHNISDYKLSTTHGVLKSHRSKTGVVYMQLWKECVLLVITSVALWQVMHLGTWCTVTHCWYQWTKEFSRTKECSLLSLLSTLWFSGTSNLKPYILCPNAWVATKSLW